MRRKGERPIPRALTRWSASHPVAHAMRTGDHWFKAWQFQSCIASAKLARDTGIPANRFAAIENGGAVSRAEIDALARAWSVSSGDLIECIGDASVIVD